jgi:hypothetical protein
MADKKRSLRATFTSEQARDLIFASIGEDGSSDDNASSDADSDDNVSVVPDDDCGASLVAGRQKTAGRVDSESSSSSSDDEEEYEQDDDMEEEAANIQHAHGVGRGRRGGRGRGQGEFSRRRNSNDDPAPNCEVYKSRNGLEIWQKQCTGSRKFAPQNVMKTHPGPTAYATRHGNTISDAFELFVTPHMMDIVLKMSNIEGKKVFADSWIEITEVELKAYVGLLLLAGVYRSAAEATEELWHTTDGRKIFRAVMSNRRFMNISTVLRFDDKETRSVRRRNDRLAPIRDVFDLWVETLSKSFVPYSNVTIDEQLVPFRGRCSFRQYMKSKPAKYGIKLWILCDSTTSYALNVQVYTGRAPGQPPEKKQGERVVHDMVEVVKGTGRNVTTDNFFTSVPLARDLLAKKLSLVGTLRKIKSEIPSEFQPDRRRELYSSVFGHQEQLTLLSYVPKKGKAVILLSTMHRDAEISHRPDKKPQIILDYNSSKGGVDTLDQMVSTFSTKRMTRRWPMVLFYNILDISAVNSYVLWSHLDPTWNENRKQRRRLFLKHLGKSLVREQLQARLALPNLALKLRSIIEESLATQNVNDDDDSDGEDGCDIATDNSPSVQDADDAADDRYTLARSGPRKRGRCAHCKRRSDKKVRVTCDECHAFVCSDHSKIVCKNCMKD